MVARGREGEEGKGAGEQRGLVRDEERAVGKWDTEVHQVGIGRRYIRLVFGWVALGPIRMMRHNL